jgi:Zn-dependent protease with chaperone function
MAWQAPRVAAVVVRPERLAEAITASPVLALTGWAVRMAPAHAARMQPLLVRVVPGQVAPRLAVAAMLAVARLVRQAPAPPAQPVARLVQQAPAPPVQQLAVARLV